jgi:dehydrogenase/reductase SDR family member 12
MAQYTEPVQARADIGLDQAGADGVSLAGRTILITGANSGIGQEITTYCAAKQAKKIIMVCRNRDKADTAKQQIMAATGYPSDQLQIVLCDLAELSQIKTAVSEQITDESIDCIVCNAGVLLKEEKSSSEGWELTFASHLLGGAYYLCQLLRPKLQASNNNNDHPRIIIVSSGGMYNTKLPDWSTLTSYSRQTMEERQAKAPSYTYDGNLVYAYAKRGQVLLAEAWSKEFPEITMVTAHPGWTQTPAVDLAYGGENDTKKYLEPMRSPWQGAEGICWLMAASRSQLQSGAFYLDRTVQRKHLAGPFFSEGGFTKNTPEEVQGFLDHLQKATTTTGVVGS